MAKLKNELKLAGLIAIVSIACLFVLQGLAYAKSGKYATFTSSYTQNASTGAVTASTSAHNTSSITRYLNSVVKSSSKILGSTGGKVGSGSWEYLSGVNIKGYSTVKGVCNVYNSGSSSSGIAETISIDIR